MLASIVNRLHSDDTIKLLVQHSSDMIKSPYSVIFYIGEFLSPLAEKILLRMSPCLIARMVEKRTLTGIMLVNDYNGVRNAPLYVVGTVIIRKPVFYDLV